MSTEPTGRMEESTTESTATEQTDKTGTENTDTAGDPMDCALLKELLREVLAEQGDAGGKGPTPSSKAGTLT